MGKVSMAGFQKALQHLPGSEWIQPRSSQPTPVLSTPFHSFAENSVGGVMNVKKAVAFQTLIC